MIFPDYTMDDFPIHAIVFAFRRSQTETFSLFLLLVSSRRQFFYLFLVENASFIEQDGKMYFCIASGEFNVELL